MRKTNSKAVKECVRNYLKENVTELLEEREIATEKPYTEYMNICREKKFHERQYYKTEFDMFKDWLQGLGGFGADIYYHGSARGFYGGKCQDILQDWLDQTDEEVRKYDSADSEELMARLCYRELSYLIAKEEK